MDEATYVDGFHDVETVKKIKYNALGKTGLRVSSLSIGAATLGNCYGTVAEAEGISLIHEGLKAGLNYIDTSPWYGKSEEVLGKALRGIPRSAYYVATKVGRYENVVERMFDFSAERTLASVDKSLRLLGLDYVDVIQAHDIEYAEDINQVISETLPALQKVVDQGKARFIGITSYSLDLLKEVVQKSPVKLSTVLNYSRNTLMDKGIEDYLPFFESSELGVINGSCTSMGLLSSVGPQSWHPADKAILNASTKARDICKARGVEIAHLALQSVVKTPGVSTNLLGCTSAAMLLSSIDVVTTPPSAEEEDLAKELEEKCFSPLPRRDWGNRGPEKHFEELNAVRKTKSS